MKVFLLKTVARLYLLSHIAVIIGAGYVTISYLNYYLDKPPVGDWTTMLVPAIILYAESERATHEQAVFDRSLTIAALLRFVAGYIRRRSPVSTTVRHRHSVIHNFRNPAYCRKRNLLRHNLEALNLLLTNNRL